MLATNRENAAGGKQSILVGWDMQDITPAKQVALYGQFNDRFSERVRDPLTVTALALESEGGGRESQAIMVSCDTASMADHIQIEVRKSLSQRLAGFDCRNIFLCATHTHTAPYLIRAPFESRHGFGWPEYRSGIITPEEYSQFMVDRICDAASTAWNKREAGGVSWQLGHAVVGHNRRTVYEDGTAVMYGSSDSVYYRGQEGPTDHGVELLYFWNRAGKLTGVVMNVACPSQVVEGASFISADYWGEVRKAIWQTYGNEVCVFAMCGAAGDQSPRDLVRRGRGEKGLDTEEYMTDIAERLLQAVVCQYLDAERGITCEAVIRQSVKEISLPFWKVSKEAYQQAKERYDFFTRKYDLDHQPLDKQAAPIADVIALYEAEGALARYYEIQQGPVYTMEAHFIRIGDIAIATNPFELFTVYGQMIKARAVANQTFISQLSCSRAGYLPSERAIGGGSYSSSVASGKVGPEGGQLLVDHSVAYINELWR